jgi:hypothetical protein
VPGGDGGADEGVELGLDDVDRARVDGVDDLGAEIDAGDPLARGGEHGGGGQADVAEADDADLKGVGGVSVRSWVFHRGDAIGRSWGSPPGRGSRSSTGRGRR